MPKLLIDNIPYDVREGHNCLEAALEQGLDLPYFCYHPALGSVGACRLCAVKTYKNEADKTGRIVMSCMEPVADGKRISIEDPEAAAARQWVTELLMTNHPHDCPICDEGGECHLQDMTVMTGHRTRRYDFKKRTFTNQYLGPLINHEMNRCIQCYRCVRYYEEHAGGHDLVAMASHNHTYFGRTEDGILESPLAGNLIDICPTGVFTDKTLKNHYIRKWDQETAPSICTQCGVGCNTIPGARYGTVRRILPRFNGEVNGYFLCDRGRFGYAFNNAGTRLREPLLQVDGARRQADRDRAWAHIKGFVRDGKRVAGIGSPRASLETNFALLQLTGTENFSTGLSAEDQAMVNTALKVYRLGSFRIPHRQDLESADAIFVLGADVTNESPVSSLPIRQAVRKGAVLYIATSRGTDLDEIAKTRVSLSPQGLQACAYRVSSLLSTTKQDAKQPFDQAFEMKVANALSAAERPLIIVGWYHGEPDLPQQAGAIAQILQAAGKDVRLLIAFPEANSLGVGLIGGTSVDEIVTRIEAGEIDRLIVVENDLVERTHDAPRLQAALSQLEQILVLDHSETVTSSLAHNVLPVTTPIESNGTWVNAEGRAARAYQTYEPEPWLPQSWEILRDLPAEDGSTRSDQWKSPEDIIAALADHEPIFQAACDIAPPPAYRQTGQKIARMSLRSSGRTAMPEINDVREHLLPPNDEETPFAFSMEGSATEPPSSLIPRFWSPSWNSQEAINKFQIELGRGLHDGAPGVRLIEPGTVGAPLAAPKVAPSGKLGRGKHAPLLNKGEVLLVPCAEIFGTENTSRQSAAIAELCPQPYLQLHPETADHLGVKEGESKVVSWNHHKLELSICFNSSVAAGIGIVPARFPETRFLQRPTIATLDGRPS